MAGITNNNISMLDLPQWQYFANPMTGYIPTVTTALSAFSIADKIEDEHDFYYTQGLTHYKFCSLTNSWITLTGAIVGVATAINSLKSSVYGYNGIPLDTAPSSTTLEIAGLNGNKLKGYKIRILSGAGAGQERTITAVDDAVVWASGVTSGGDINGITDTTKRWEINEWVGYQLRIVLPLTGIVQVSKILYNTADTLTISNANYDLIDTWNNRGFTPVAAAGYKYYIESSIITVDTPWDVSPDLTSTYVILSDGLFTLSANATAGYGGTLQYYDDASDAWHYKMYPMTNFTQTALGTDYQSTLVSDAGGVNLTATATSGSIKSVSVTSAGWTLDAYANYQLKITAGTGVGQVRVIAGNNADTIFVYKSFEVTPNNTSVFTVSPNTDAMYLVGNAQGSMLRYSPTENMWSTGEVSDYGQCNHVSVNYQGQAPIALTSGVVNANGITVLNPTPTAGGTGYAVGDLFNITTGGTVGKGRVEAVSTGGVVTAVSLYSCGLNYTTGAGKATTIISGAGNNGLTVNITTVASVCRFTTIINHNLAIGDTFTIKGASEAGWNTTRTVLGADSVTTFDTVIAGAGASTIAAANNQSTSTVVDATKNWVVNEHAGKIVDLMIAGLVPTHQTRKILSNTATVLTLDTGSITQGANGTSKYIIYNKHIFGRATSWDRKDKQGFGYATSGSATTLVDTTKDWYTDQWAGYKMKIISGVGYDKGEITITGNTSNTLSFSSITDTIDTTSKYLIQTTWGTPTTVTNTTNAVITDTTKKWAINEFAGHRVKLVAGDGTGNGGTVTELIIASNTATALTCTGVFTLTPNTTTTVYAINAMNTVGIGCHIRHIYGNTLGQKGKHIIIFRGAATAQMYKYDITTELVEDFNLILPKAETLTTSTVYAYDGEDRIYINPAALNRILYYTYESGEIKPYVGVPTAQITAMLSNRMTMLSKTIGTDKIKFLYLGQAGGQILYKLTCWV